MPMSAFLASRGPPFGPSCAQELLPHGFKLAPRWPQGGPKMAQGGLRLPQHGPEPAHTPFPPLIYAGVGNAPLGVGTPRQPQDCTKMALDG
jgi:hypothetical protein